MEDHGGGGMIERWLRQQAHISNADPTSDQYKHDGLTSSPEFHSVPKQQSPSPPFSPSPSPSPHHSPVHTTHCQQPQQTHSAYNRSRPLLRMRTVGSLILPPASPVKSKIGTQPALLQVRRNVHDRSGSLSPVFQSWAPTDPPVNSPPITRDGSRLGIANIRCRSQSPIASHTASDDADGGMPSFRNGEVFQFPSDCDSSEDLVSEKQLELLAPKIGSKLNLLTSFLGLQDSDYEYALKEFNLAESQALYILKKWFGAGERKVGELCLALEKTGMSQLAEWCRYGDLEGQLKRHEEKQRAKRRERMRRVFPGSFDVGHIDATDWTRPGQLSESRLLKHNTMNSHSSTFQFQEEEKNA